uniref:Uncharacterized protein n=1 Tax=Lygus hesperus TaxID=30085 RepID=A0A146KU50_LYGHE
MPDFHVNGTSCTYNNCVMDDVHKFAIWIRKTTLNLFVVRHNNDLLGDRNVEDEAAKSSSYEHEDEGLLDYECKHSIQLRKARQSPSFYYFFLQLACNRFEKYVG